MTNWFVSRHLGAIEWAKQQPIQIDRWESHLDIAQVQEGDTVIGTLPVHLAAEVCAKGARFVFLQVPIAATQRGQELSAATLTDLGCTLQAFWVEALP